MVFSIDGGSRGNPGPAGYGVRVADAHGRLVDELYGSIGVATNRLLRVAVTARSAHGPCWTSCQLSVASTAGKDDDTVVGEGAQEKRMAKRVVEIAARTTRAATQAAQAR